MNGCKESAASKHCFQLIVTGKQAMKKKVVNFVEKYENHFLIITFFAGIYFC